MMVSRRHLIVIGQVIVDFTDNIRDQLAVVEELTDRLKGVVNNAEADSEEDIKQLADIISTIERNVQTLAGKNRHLHSFGHRLDDPASPFQFNEVIEEAVSFSNRAARLHRVTLNREKSETLPELTADPVLMHLLILLLINDMLEQVGVGGKVGVRSAKAENGVLVEIVAEGSFEPADQIPDEEEQQQYHDLVQHLVADLGGSLTSDMPVEGRKRTSLVLPA